MTDTSKDLLPCPFCGPQEKEEDLPALFAHDMVGVGPIEYSVRCHRCGVEVGGEYEESTVATWNTRANPDLTAAAETMAEAAVKMKSAWLGWCADKNAQTAEASLLAERDFDAALAQYNAVKEWK